MALPCVLFSSSVEAYIPFEFVKNIFNVEDVPKPKVITDNILGYEWSFENKYYSTSVNLCTTHNRTIGDQDFAESVEAFVHFFDPNQLSSFELTKAWIPYLELIEPEIKMLVCECSRYTDDVGRKETFEWCLKNGFELVELSPEKDDDDEEDDFPETTGMARIVQALNAHTWPNMTMKDSPPVQSPYLRQMMKEQHLINKQDAQTSLQCDDCACDSNKSNSYVDLTENSDSEEKQNIVCHKGDIQTPGETDRVSGASVDSNCDKSRNSEDQLLCSQSSMKSSERKTEQNENTQCHEQLPIDGIDWNHLLADTDNKESGTPLTDSELGVEEFEQLFMKLKVMKDQAEKMPLEERKKYAEKVAVSFWKAIGGDDDEILGLGDSDED